MPDVYVLMRVYRAPDAGDDFWGRLDQALLSVKKNAEDYAKRGGKVLLIVNDDTPGPDTAFPEELLARLAGKDLDFKVVKTDGKGSAYAAYNVRKAFLDTADDDDAIAVSLDQDDTLTEGAVRRIVRSMPKGGIVVTPYKMIDSENLDITDDGGRKHNLQAKKLACRCRRCRKDVSLPELSSIGWTKSYTKPALRKYLDDLALFLKEDRRTEAPGDPVEVYFSDHRAYEDFLDFYALLLKGCTVSGTRRETHVYHKHKESITSKPEVEDFLNHRTAHLVALVDLCYRNKADLHPDFEPDLLRYVARKVYHVDHIISDYLNRFSKDGETRFAEFAAKMHDGYFANKFCRLALGENRGDGYPQDKALFKYATGRGESSRSNIENLFSDKHLNAISDYKVNVRNAPVRFAVRKAVECERHIAGADKKKQQDDEDIVKELSGGKWTPHQRRFFYLCVLLAIILTMPFWLLPLFKHIGYDFLKYQELSAAIISIWVAVLTFSLNEISKVKLLASQEKSLQKLYYSEFVDFIRHLEANLKVMVQIRKRMKESPSHLRVEDIHFDNLSWPETSCLFSNDMAKIISKERVDDFSRLKVNVRNINTRSKWLKDISGKDGKNLLADLEWEITRHFGYLVNMYYLQSHRFSFGTQHQLDLFLDENSIKNQLTELFMDYPAEERSAEVDYFVGKYYEDRRSRRDVLVY